MDRLNIAEKRLPQDGRPIKMRVQNREIEVRVSASSRWSRRRHRDAASRQGPQTFDLNLRNAAENLCHVQEVAVDLPHGIVS